MTTNHSVPDGGACELSIVFFYYKDLPAAMKFYEETMGYTLAIDQGWSKIYRIGGSAHVGLVDEAHGMHKAAPVKPVQLCVRVPNVDAWFDHVQSRGASAMSEMFDSEHLGIRAFTFEDPEGYQIELQSATRQGA